MKRKYLLFLCLVIFILILIEFSGCNFKNKRNQKIFTGNPEREFLGVQWKCSFDELQKILDQSPFPTKFKSVDCDQQLTTYQYEGNYFFPNAKRSIFMFFNNELIDICVVFLGQNEQEAKNIFDDLKEIVKEDLKILPLNWDYEFGLNSKKKEDFRYVSGEIGRMSFTLGYGAHFEDYSGKLVFLSAKFSPLIEKK